MKSIPGQQMAILRASISLSALVNKTHQLRTRLSERHLQNFLQLRTDVSWNIDTGSISPIDHVDQDSAHLEHGARRKVGGVRMASGDLDDGVLRNVQAAADEKRADEKRTVDCIENDKAPKAPIAGKKKERSTDEDENEQGATKYLKYGKGIG